MFRELLVVLGGLFLQTIFFLFLVASYLLPLSLNLVLDLSKCSSKGFLSGLELTEDLFGVSQGCGALQLGRLGVGAKPWKNTRTKLW